MGKFSFGISMRIGLVLIQSVTSLLLLLFLSQQDRLRGQEINLNQDDSNRTRQTESQSLVVDERLVQANGISKTSGRFINMYTDVRDRADVDELVVVFDQAVEFWCEYFSVDPALTEGWKLSVMVMAGDKTRFIKSGLYPENLPNFPAGYQRGSQFWLYVQPGNYYTRHLFLHEGTHAFMWQFLGGAGAPWYAEGMAELLAVHRWSDEKLQMNCRDNRREDVPHWGRVKLVREAVTDDKQLSLTEVMEADNQSFQQVNWYAWAWAACRFFDSHPAYLDRFRELHAGVRDGSPAFSARFWESLREDHQQINRDWNLFLQEIDYGVDMPALLVSNLESNSDGTLRLKSERGWQDSGLTLTSDQSVELVAEGRYVLRRTTKPWESEANGVTIEYFQGLPLGRLVAAVVTEEELDQGRFSVIDIGRSGKITGRAGKLFLKINESPADISDNEGELSITVYRN